MKNFQILCLSLLSIILMGQSCKNNEEIGNSFLVITWDPGSSCLEVSQRSKVNPFIKNLLPAWVNGTVKKTGKTSPVFGNGSSLVLTSKQGSIDFTLYPGQPFLFVNSEFKNKTGDTLDVHDLIPVTFQADLGRPVEGIMTLGTGGLLPPDRNPGSYVFLATVDPQTRNGVITGWLTNVKGSGVIFSDLKDQMVSITPRIDYGHYRIPPGGTGNSETLLIGFFDDARLGLEQFADAIALNQDIRMKPRSAVYCTWYDEKNGGAGSEKSSIDLARFISANLKSYGLGVIQIDDQWQAGGKYNGPCRGFDRTDPAGGYPTGMSATAKAISQEGLIAGIWWMPFARNHQDPEYKDRQNWFAYRLNGLPFETPWGGTSLDLTNQEVLDHVAGMASTLHNWGFNYFKMDGLWTGTVTEQVYINDGYKNDSMGNCKPLNNPMKTQIEAFRDGLKVLRKAVGDEVFFSGCCISQNMRSFGASIGLVNSMRIGPDFNHDGQSIRTGAIRASRLYFLNGRIWWNDPDPSMIREGGQSSADPSAKGIGGINRARMLPSYVAVSGQFFLSSDWLPDLPEDRIEIMKRCMASHHGVARPVDLFDRFLPSIWLATDDHSETQRNVIGVFNWDTIPKEIGCSIGRAGLKDQIDYFAFDFWENRSLPKVKGSFLWNLPPESCRIVAMRAREDHPVVVSTSAHVTQGMIDLSAEKWHDGSLSGTSKVIAGDEYELRIAGLNDGGNWKITKAEITGDHKEARIQIQPIKEEGWQRVLINSRENQALNWKLTFENQQKP